MYFLIINFEINILRKTYKILIAPLDWGLGHATRSIPLITGLLAEGCEVLIAADGTIQALLEQEFRELTFLPLKGYRIQYSQQKKWLPLKIVLQIPRLLFSIFSEHQWLKKMVKDHSIDAIISDNRFGLYHKHIPSIYITHQLLIKTGNRFSEGLLMKLHYWFIKKYYECWIPDFEGNSNIAGQLSHPSPLPANVKYIGGLSRFETKPYAELKYDLLILLSGPEPQRTIFEKELLFQLKEYNGTALLVQGLPKANKISKTNENNTIHVRNHIATQELNLVIEQSKIIISRSGYTTVMDMLKLQKKAILIPTPGQTEQEYLAQYLMLQKLFYSVEQHEFLLSDALEKADQFPYLHSSFNMEQYKSVIQQFVLTISTTQ